MIKLFGMLVAGVVLGVATVLAQLAMDNEPAPVPQPVATSPQMRAPALAAPSASVPAPEAVSLAQIRDISPDFARYAALYDLLRAVDANRLDALLDEAAALKLNWATWIIYTRYLELAPRAALDRLSDGTEPPHLVSRAMLSWARRDLDAALAFLDTMAEPQRTQTAKNILNVVRELGDDRQDEIARRFSIESHLAQVRATAEAATNPAAAWQQALAFERGQAQNQALLNIAHRWFGQDPVAALAALDDVPHSGNRASWQRRLLTRWSGTDREAALQWTLSRPPSAKRGSLIAEVAAAAAQDSPAEMLALAETLEPKERRQVAERVLEVWAKSDPRAAISALEELADRRLTETTRYSLVQTWSRSDPLAAFEWARTQPTLSDRTRSLAVTLQKIAQSDPREALALAENLDAGARSNAIENVLRHWGRDDARAAAAWLDASQHKTHGTVAAVIRAYAELDAQEAFDWLQAQPVEVQRQSASLIVARLAEESPQAALEMIDDIDDPNTAAIASSQLVYRWAANDPRAAVRAITRMRSDSRPDLYRDAFRVWSRYDTDAATAFLGQIPASGRDPATVGVMQQVLSDGEVESAQSLFDRIVDAESRQDAARTMYFHFLRTDPERAARYRYLSGLTVNVEDGSIIYSVPAQGR